MWLRTALCLSWLLQVALGQHERATLRRSNDPSGRCLYSFTVESPHEASCPGAEMEGVRSRLALLEALVSRTLGERGEEVLREAYARAAGERSQLQREKEALSEQVKELKRRVEELAKEAQRLKETPCHRPPPPGAALQEIPSPASEPSVYQELKAEMTEVYSASSLLPETVQNYTGTDCGELLSVGEPVSHRRADSITGKYGVWLQDPEPVGPPYGAGTVWRMDTVGKDVRQLFAYEDMAQFSRGFPTKVLLLPEPVESTGAAVYRGALYYQRRRSRTLIRYDLASESVAARRDLPHAGFHGQFPYAWGGYTDIDLAVDEGGLWAVYSTSKARGAIVLSRLDPRTLEVQRSWETGVRKSTVANAFVACGQLYTVASYSAPNTTLNHALDTETGRGRDIALPFQNRYRYNSMVDYNHALRKLFSWDNFHMVTYDVRLGPSAPPQGEHRG